MELPLISAIVSTYNSEKFFRGKIEDLLNQTIFLKLEIIVINSGSTQKEDEIIKDYLNIPNIKYVKTVERETIYKAWNKGIHLSSGKYITNANTDDRLHPKAYQMMSEFLEAHNDVAMVYADQLISHIPNESFKTVKVKKKYKPDFNELLLLERCFIGSQPMWRHSLHNEENWYFDETLEIAGDYEFECKIAAKYKIEHIPETLGIYYLSKSSENKEYQNQNATFEETYFIMKKYSILYFLTKPENEIKKIAVIFKFVSFIPQKFYSAFRKIFNKLFPRKELHSYSFIIWFLSLLYSTSDNKAKALKLLLNKNEKYKNPLISKRLREL